MLETSTLHALTLFAEDLPAATTFYGDALGLTEVYRDDNSVVFRLGPTMVNVLSVQAAPGLLAPAAPGPAGAGPRAVMTVHVSDVDATCAELAARGVTMVNGPVDRPWGVRTASFADPAGHVWEVAHSLAG